MNELRSGHLHSSHVSADGFVITAVFVVFVLAEDNYAKLSDPDRGKMPSFCPGVKLFPFMSQARP